MHPFIPRLELELGKHLPGLEAQVLMAPRTPTRYFRQSENAKKAAVLLLLYPMNNSLYFALMKRKSDIKGDTHAGQVSLPGGRMEESDQSLLDCALREAEEELGIIKSDVQPLGQLTQLYVFASNHMVYPFVGYSAAKPDFLIDEREVDWLIEVDTNYLLSAESKKTIDLTTHGIELKNVPYFDIEQEIVWGATAMILSEFLHVWERVVKHQHSKQ